MPLPRCLMTLALMLTPAGWLAASCHADLPVLTVLHAFSAGGPGDLMPLHNANSDGARPEAPLVLGTDGALYGTASDGGVHGTGVVFKINPNGTGFILLHSFGALDRLFTNDTNPAQSRNDLQAAAETAEQLSVIKTFYLHL